jgi:hypothetical protein
MMDYLKLYLYIGIAAMLVAIVCLLLVAFANSGSRNIPLALGTVFGALLLLWVQIIFELRSKETKTVFATEFTTDNQDYKIAAYRYKSGGPMLRSMNELEANKYLRNTNIQAFGDNDKLWKDMSLFSLVAYLWTEQHDWQISRENFNNSNMPLQTFQFLSKSDDKRQCVKVDLSAIQAMLRGAHNAFAEFKPVGLPFDYMCLPPNSSILIGAEHIVISSPYCTIDFAIQQIPAMQLNQKPGTIDITLLADKRPRFETRTGVIRVTVRYDWMRAQSRDMPRYQAWANDVVERARQWFENGTPEGGLRFVDGIE